MAPTMQRPAPPFAVAAPDDDTMEISSERRPAGPASEDVDITIDLSGKESPIRGW